MTGSRTLATAAHTARNLRQDRSGLALLEFAFSLPLVMGIGCYGIEIANLALINMRVSQVALNLADNASRVGEQSSLSTQQLREVDINDILQAARYQGGSLNLTTNGRIILSSLENVQQTYDTAPVQRIHWQRCLGRPNTTDYTAYNSHYGTTTTTAGTTATSANKGTDDADGMGEAGSLVTAPSGSGVMFVEINYMPRGLFGTLFVSYTVPLRYTASFIVRDRRDFSRLFNPTPTSTLSTCNLYAS